MQRVRTRWDWKCGSLSSFACGGHLKLKGSQSRWDGFWYPLRNLCQFGLSDQESRTNRFTPASSVVTSRIGKAEKVESQGKENQSESEGGNGGRRVSCLVPLTLAACLSLGLSCLSRLCLVFFFVFFAFPYLSESLHLDLSLHVGIQVPFSRQIGLRSSEFINPHEQGRGEHNGKDVLRGHNERKDERSLKQAREHMNLVHLRPFPLHPLAHSLTS